MRKIGISLLLLTVVFVSCKRTPKSDDTPKVPKWEFEQLKVEKELFPKKDSTKGKGMDLTMEFNYPSHFESDSLLQSVQSSFVVAFAGDDYKDKSPKTAFEQYEKVVEDEFMEMGSFAVDDGPDISSYFKHITTTVSDTTDLTITARTQIEDYTGGAHGSYNVFYYNIDTRTGEIFKEKEFFKKDSEEQLTKLLEEKAKTTKNRQGDNITLLEPQEVVPNGNFYLNSEGIVFVYNQYEIAPYSDGLIEITLPYAQIKTLINPLFEQIVELKSKIKAE